MDVKEIAKKIEEVKVLMNKRKLKKDEKEKIEKELAFVKKEMELGLYLMAEERLDSLLRNLKKGLEREKPKEKISEKLEEERLEKKKIGGEGKFEMEGEKKKGKEIVKGVFREKKVLKEREEDKKRALEIKNILDQIKVSEVMKSAPVIDEKTGIEEIVEKFIEKKYKGIFVSRKGKIVGMINLLGLLEGIRRGDSSKLKASDMMKEVISINKDDNLSKAILIMNMHKSDCLAVIEKNKFLGVVTRERILNKIGKKLVMHRTAIKDQKIETKVDELLEILRKGETTMKELERKLGVNGEQIEEWLKILEEQGVIRIRKHFGKIKIENVR